MLSSDDRGYQETKDREGTQANRDHRSVCGYGFKMNLCSSQLKRVSLETFCVWVPGCRRKPGKPGRTRPQGLPWTGRLQRGARRGGRDGGAGEWDPNRHKLTSLNDGSSRLSLSTGCRWGRRQQRALWSSRTGGKESEPHLLSVRLNRASGVLVLPFIFRERRGKWGLRGVSGLQDRWLVIQLLVRTYRDTR